MDDALRWCTEYALREQGVPWFCGKGDTAHFALLQETVQLIVWFTFDRTNRHLSVEGFA